jgi:hypothetical protein
MSHSIGCDPELMLIREGKLISALPIIRGRKRRQQRVRGGTIMSDNVLAEFTIPPARTKKEFTAKIRTVLHSLKEVVGKDIQLVAIPSASFPQEELEDEEAKRFGCDPDFDAWSCSMNEISSDAALKRFRCAGGHVHIGHPFIKDSDKARIEFTKMVDVFLGIPSILIDNHKDSLNRRSLYGKAGAHRPKKYGIEYRALSNFWISNPFLTGLVFNLSIKALEVYQKEGTRIVDEITEKEIVDIINKSKRKNAERIVKTYLSPRIGKRLTKQILDTSISVKDRNIEENWKL